jgi:hypothetical protein
VVFVSFARAFALNGEVRELEWWLVGSSDRKIGHEWLRFGCRHILLCVPMPSAI